jgi:2-amino-4-hydroxy-6-hydroxymethyldihydropteridine diphosphokinase
MCAPPEPVTAYLSLGANLGDRAATLAEAIRQLSLAEGCQVLAVSPVYESAPWGVTDQPPFLNLALALRTTLSHHDLLALCKSTEAALGRIAGPRWGPRAVDLDILLYADLTLEDPDLHLPHLHLTERQFVLVPLHDIASDLCLPDGRRVSDLANPSDPDLTLLGHLELPPSPGPASPPTSTQQ